MADQAQAPEMVDLSKYIEIRLMEDRPHIRGRRVPVALIAHSARSQRWDAAELAYQFTLTEAEVLAALLYYEEHAAEIEALEADEQARMDDRYQCRSSGLSPEGAHRHARSAGGRRALAGGAGVILLSSVS